MGLLDFKHASTSIPLPPNKVMVDDELVEQENSFVVRGLGLDDFGVLLTNHLMVITQAAEAYAAHKKNVTSTASLQGFVQILITDFPTLMSEVISVAADEPGAAKVRLPLAIQIAALTEIARLTLIDAGGLGNLLAMLGAALKGTVSDDHLASLKAMASNSFIGGFGKKSTS